MGQHEETTAEYWKAVKDNAEEATTVARAAFDESGDGDHDAAQEARQEWLHETVDGSEWVIYTWRAKWVVGNSPNDSRGFDEGLIQCPQGGPIPWEQLAFCAFEADIQEHSEYADIFDWEGPDEDSDPDEGTDEDPDPIPGDKA